MIPLIDKELREHGGVLVAATIVFLGFAGLTYLGASRQSPPQLPINLLGLVLTIQALFLAPLVGQRVLHREYNGKTQLFLETLPVSRWEIVVAKLFVGAAYSWIVTSAVTGWAMYGSSRPLPEDATFATFTRALSFSLTMWFCIALFSLLGRYRVPLLVATILVIAYLSTEHDVDLTRTGPLALIDQRLGYEGALPWGPLRVCALASGLSLLATLLLTLTREGSTAALLAERMSQREKVFIAGLFIATAFGLTLVNDDDDDEPYEFEANVVEIEDGVEVRLRGAEGGGDEHEGDEQDRDRALATSVAGTLQQLRAELAMDALPPLFLSKRADMSAREYARGWISKGEGLLVRFHPQGEGFAEERFLAWVIRELIDERSRDRASLEPNAWLLAGVGHAFLSRDDDDAFASRERWLLRALHGTPDGPQEEWLDGWYRYEERVGDDVAQAVAWSALVTAQRVAGRDAVRALLQDTLAREVHDDARAAIHEALHPLSKKLQTHLGMTRTQFVDAWRAQLDEHRQEHAARLAKVVRPRASLRPTPDSDEARVTWFLEDEGALGEREVRFRWARLGRMNRPLDDDDIGTLLIAADRAREGRPFPRGWAAGTRVAWSLEVFDPELQCDVTTGWSREPLP